MAACSSAPSFGSVSPDLVQDRLPNEANGAFTPAVLDMLQQAIRSAREIHPGNGNPTKDVCAFIGTTGSGKSTIVNSLLGRDMVGRREGSKFLIEVAPGQEEIARIGHRRFDSETLYAQAYEQPTFPYTLVDCGGFLDTRGAESEVAIALSMKLILENARTVRLAVCFDTHGLEMDRGGRLCSLLKIAYRSLLTEGYRTEKSSIALILTKAERSDTGWHYTDDPNQDALRLLRDFRNEALEGGEERALFDFIIREEGRFLRVFKPLERASVAALRTLFGEMEGIQNPRGKFRLTYSAYAAISIMKGFTQIALSGGDLLDRYRLKVAEGQRHQNELAALNQNIERLEQTVQRLAPEMNPTVNEIDEAKAALIRENQQIIERENQEIEHLLGLIAEEDAGLEAVRERIALLKREGEQEIEYWSQSINQPGIKGQKGSTYSIKRESSGFLGIFGGSKTTETTTIPATPGRSIGHDFEYRGPRVVRIEKEKTHPEGTWSGEVESADKTSYKIHFDSGIGVDAVASIRAIIKKIDDPSEQQRLITFQDEETRRERQKNHFEEQIRSHREVVNRSQGIILAAENIRERLNDIRDELRRVQVSKEDLEQRIVRTNAERRGIEEEIAAKQNQFEFLHEYLRLSQDDHVRNEPLVAQFLRKYDDYQHPPVAP